VPVSSQLMKISHLFQQSWLDSVIAKGEDKLDGSLMYNFFEQTLLDYCRNLLGDKCLLKRDEKTLLNYPYNDQGSWGISDLHAGFINKSTLSEYTYIFC